MNRSKTTLPDRQSFRIQKFDYSHPGLYFVTICTHRKFHLFGFICDAEMVFSPSGIMADQCWRMIPDHFPHVKLHDYIIMPNHVHGILELLPDDHVGPYRRSALVRGERIMQSNQFQFVIPGSLPSIIRGFKIGVTKWHRENTAIKTVWQRNFHESIIRDKRAYHQITQYIRNNPKNWCRDRFNLG